MPDNGAGGGPEVVATKCRRVRAEAGRPASRDGTDDERKHACNRDTCEERDQASGRREAAREEAVERRSEVESWDEAHRLHSSQDRDPDRQRDESLQAEGGAR